MNAPDFIPEPRRATTAAIDKIIHELPYGAWRTRTSRLVIHDRGYRPIWQRNARGVWTRARAGEWVRNITGEYWFYLEGFGVVSPRYDRAMRERLREVLRALLGGAAPEDFCVGYRQRLLSGPLEKRKPIAAKGTY